MAGVGAGIDATAGAHRLTYCAAARSRRADAALASVPTRSTVVGVAGELCPICELSTQEARLRMVRRTDCQSLGKAVGADPGRVGLRGLGLPIIRSRELCRGKVVARWR